MHLEAILTFHVTMQPWITCFCLCCLMQTHAFLYFRKTYCSKHSSFNRTEAFSSLIYSSCNINQDTRPLDALDVCLRSMLTTNRNALLFNPPPQWRSTLKIASGHVTNNLLTFNHDLIKVNFFGREIIINFQACYFFLWKRMLLISLAKPHFEKQLPQDEQLYFEKLIFHT